MRSSLRARPIVTHELDSRGEPVRRPAPRLMLRMARVVLVLGAVVMLLAAGGVAWALQAAGRTPREWAPYLDRRAEKHRWSIVEGTALVTRWLIHADRLGPDGALVPPWRLGADIERSGTPPAGRIRIASSIEALEAAIATAQPGDVVQVAPGTYRHAGRALSIVRGGTDGAAITLRAARLGDVVIETDAVALFRIQAPHWRFENLEVRGVCADHTWCEHAFHIVGDATNTVIRNNRLADWNAHIKINGEGGRFPDGGLVQGNTLTNTQPRRTTNPVTPIDLVAANGWSIQENFIADFVREGGGNPTYGAFVKGAGEHNVLTRNVVLCEWKLRGRQGQRVGLSIGGGGTGEIFRRDGGRSGFEHMNGLIRDNLIAFCSDVGVYVNRAPRSSVIHNTLLDTAGIDIRFPESSASVVANFVDGPIRSRDGGVLRIHANVTAPLLGLFVGYHAPRAYFVAPASLDLTWNEPPERTEEGDREMDLCGRMRPAKPFPGAFEDFSACRR